ncbi:MAG: ABC transporter substrate-binding protein [Chloroflexota bacterium]|nr:ABC transporter substrate-binding protein [Chloroflexota bacterium]
MRPFQGEVRCLVARVLVSSLVLGPLMGFGAATGISAQSGATPGALNCSPPAPPAFAGIPGGTAPTPVAQVPDDAIQVTMGYVPVSIFAPVFVAKEKGYFAEAGLDVTLEALPGGSDMVVLTATGEFDAGIGGAGPAFWNGMAQGLPLRVIAPGHGEGDPVATPLMISREACESGAIASVADLRGKKVAINARGATEFWLSRALATGGLTLDDISLQTLAFPDAVTALAAGAIAASMVGEPLATKAEQDGLAVRLLTSFDVQEVQPTLIYGNAEWLDANPDAATGLVTGYLRAARDLSGDGFTDPVNLAIIEQYTGVPAALVAAAVQPVYAVDGEIDTEGLNLLQQFFRERDQLDYSTDLDAADFVDFRFVDAALATLGPADQN